MTYGGPDFIEIAQKNNIMTSCPGGKVNWDTVSQCVFLKQDTVSAA